MESGMDIHYTCAPLASFSTDSSPQQCHSPPNYQPHRFLLHAFFSSFWHTQSIYNDLATSLCPALFLPPFPKFPHCIRYCSLNSRHITRSFTNLSLLCSLYRYASEFLKYQSECFIDLSELMLLYELVLQK